MVSAQSEMRQGEAALKMQSPNGIHLCLAAEMVTVVLESSSASP